MEIPTPDSRLAAAASARQAELTKPPGALGRLEELACWLAARLHSPIPDMPRGEVFVFAADHGVAARGVSAFPQAVTTQMLKNFAAGGAAINVLAALEQVPVHVVDVGVASDEPTPNGVRAERIRAGTRDLCKEAAMTESELSRALEVGERCAREAAGRGARFLIAGDMGIANTTAAACLICALTGATVEEIVGRGTGIDDAGLERKRTTVHEALARLETVLARTSSDDSRARQPGVASSEARQILAHVGGLEIAAMTGLYCEAARRGMILVLDGFISSSAALAAVALQPGTSRWLLASHRSAETGHGVALTALGLSPFLDLGMRLGEGTGAVLTLSLIRAALALHREMATFTQAGVSTRASSA
ncbi:MAG TPA: nicotinate-nucleotide--dimethylbenzimidazole phosphoribosyltransferase [Steroidobacteraceae bacterium]|nr:nicotinate-nucleotide--dimethylbenzimidazole phosphoribosyltransferase [Steroidobacteraceae bacterium]